MIDLNETGKRITEIIKNNFKSKTECAEKVGVSPAAVSAWTRGEKLPSIDNLVYLADECKAKIDEIIVRK